jgi:hypothetical protein
MQTKKKGLILPLGLLLFAFMACNYSATTANISSLKIGKDKDVSQETSSFAARDTIYALATISNAPGALKVKGRVLIEDVAGQQRGPIPGLEKTLDLPGSTTATFTFSPPTAGWPAGKYKLEVLMMDESGAQKDQKTVDFTIL